LTLDPLSAMAAADKEKLDGLLREVSSESAAVQAMLAEIAEKEKLYSGGKGQEGEGLGLDSFSAEMEGAFALKPDMRFMSNEPFGIPPLRADRLADFPATLTLWPGDDLGDPQAEGLFFLVYSCSCRRLDFTRTILAFYTEDHRFESLWQTPDVFAGKLINSGMQAIVAPNYSLWYGQAQAVHIWNTYRSRWIGRYFQEAGLRLIPDVNWADEKSFDFCLAGIPVGAPVISWQIQNISAKDSEGCQRAQQGMKIALERLQPQGVIVYGSKLGQQMADEVVPQGLPQVRLSTLMDMRRGKLANKL